MAPARGQLQQWPPPNTTFFAGRGRRREGPDGPGPISGTVVLRTVTGHRFQGFFKAENVWEWNVFSRPYDLLSSLGGLTLQLFRQCRGPSGAKVGLHSLQGGHHCFRINVDRFGGSGIIQLRVYFGTGRLAGGFIFRVLVAASALLDFVDEASILADRLCYKNFRILFYFSSASFADFMRNGRGDGRPAFDERVAGGCICVGLFAAPLAPPWARPGARRFPPRSPPHTPTRLGWPPRLPHCARPECRLSRMDWIEKE